MADLPNFTVDTKTLRAVLTTIQTYLLDVGVQAEGNYSLDEALTIKELQELRGLAADVLVDIEDIADLLKTGNVTLT